MTPPGTRFLQLVGRINGAIASVLFGVLTLVVSLQVLTRFVLHIPFIWSEEIARFLFFWTVLLGAALSVKNRRHFVIDVTMGKTDRWPTTMRVLFNVFPHICIIAFAIVLLIEGIAYTRIGLLRTSTNSQLNMAVVYAAIPVFAALSLVYALGNLVQDFARRHERTPASAPASASE